MPSCVVYSREKNSRIFVRSRLDFTSVGSSVTPIEHPLVQHPLAHRVPTRLADYLARVKRTATPASDSLFSSAFRKAES